MIAYLRAGWELGHDVRSHVEIVHRLSSLGAVYTNAGHGASRDGFDAEWRGVTLVAVDGDLIDRCELFDEANLDAALARFDELSRSARRLHNAASETNDRFDSYFAAGDWVSMGQLLTADTYTDDRRRVVNAGIRRGRDVEIANMQTLAELGVAEARSVVIATRGQHLALLRTRFSGRDLGPQAFHTDVVDIIEINADNRITARVAFDPDNVDAAFAELESRYVAGETAAYARTWSLIAAAHAALNRHELPGFTPDWVTIDHRRAIAFAPGDMTAYVHATWNDSPNDKIYIEAVHRLSDLGAVVTNVTTGTSKQGFEAEWRIVNLYTFEDDLFNRCEVFDEEDLDAAIARFDELSRPTPQLENSATRAYDRQRAHFLAGDWDALEEMIADDHYGDDRRRVVNDEIRRGRDAEMASLRAIADLGVTDLTVIAIAIRGDRLALTRMRGATSGPSWVHTELLRLVEIDERRTDLGPRRLRPRRHRRRVRGTQRAVPRWRSHRPCSDVVGHRRGVLPPSIGASFPRRQRIGSASIIGRSCRSRPATWRRPYVRY